jgi:ribosomal protein S12 methylthiotransferase accessory factor
MRVDVIFDEDGTYSIEYCGKPFAPGPGPLPAPPVVFIGSLAACSGLFAVEYLRARKLPFAGLRVIGEGEHAEDPRRIVDVRMRVILPHPLPERHLRPLQRSVDLCTLKNTLEKPPAVIAEVCTQGGAESRPESPAPTRAA